jgi:hypothetical protein
MVSVSLPEDERMSAPKDPPSHLPIAGGAERQAVEDQLAEDSLEAKITEPSKLIDQKRKRLKGDQRGQDLAG